MICVRIAEDKWCFLKFKILPFKEGLRRGIINSIYIFVAWQIYQFAQNEFLDATEWVRELIMYSANLEKFILIPWLLRCISILASIFLMLPVYWILGHFEILKIITYISKFIKKIFGWKSETKYLFCVRIKDKSFFGGYPIGLVTQIIHKNEKIFYNICFPNIAGLIIMPKVPEEEVEICEESVQEIVALYMSLGAL